MIRGTPFFLADSPFMKTSNWISKSILVAVVGLGVHTPLSAAPETHEFDPAHSFVGFRIKHLFAYVHGRFNDVKGTLVIDPDKPEDATVTATIGVASISTGVEKRDAHLRTPDFFDAEKFKEITFKSKSVEKTGDKTAKVKGDLTIHGVTKEVTLDVEYFGHGADGQGSIRSGWRGMTTLKRSDYGITFGKDIEGVPLIGDQVDIILDMEGIVKP